MVTTCMLKLFNFVVYIASVFMHKEAFFLWFVVEIEIKRNSFNHGSMFGVALSLL